MKKEFNYTKTRLQQAYILSASIICTAIGFAAMLSFLLDDSLNKILISTLIILSAILVSFIANINNFKNKKAMFYVHCTNQDLTIHSPTDESSVYTLELADIVEIKRYILKHKGREYFYLLTDNGQEYKLPMQFGFDPRKLVKFIQKTNPNLKIVKYYSKSI